MKRIFETLAALGTGAALLTACAASQPPSEVPAAVEIKPAEMGGPGAPQTPQATDTNVMATAATKTDAPAAPAATIPNADATPAPSSTATPQAQPAKAVVKAPKKTATAKKPGSANGCGEGTCG